VSTLNQNNQINLQSMGQPFPDPFEPTVELTVCPQGPPACQFQKIQAAIEAAPGTDPIGSWDKPPRIPLIRVAAGLYTEQLTLSKNIWLRGAGRERVTLRPNPLIRQATISIAPLHAFVQFGIGIGLQGLTIEGPVHISGIVSGLISDNHFRPAVFPESDSFGGLYLVAEPSVT
jgi:hypothetical protein